MSTHNRLWFEEEIEENIRWVFGVKRILNTSVSEFQDIELLESGPFGKILILDGKVQSSEFDEFVYHELLVHPSLLYHSNPQNVFIMGGGEGSTAREILRNKNVKEVVMCDIDKEVVSFCQKHWEANKSAFANPKLKLVINDAKAELINSDEKFDVIVGDLADPIEGGPCYQLYTEEFYSNVIKKKMHPDGIFVTQAGPAGILSAKTVFSPIHKTLSQVFKYVRAYQSHIPSYADTWGWVMASDKPFPSYSSEEIDALIKNNVEGELRFLDGETVQSVFALNKHVRRILNEETSTLKENLPLFIHGQGSLKTSVTTKASLSNGHVSNGVVSIRNHI